MLESYKWMGWDGMGWKSLLALILRAPLCGANDNGFRTSFRFPVFLGHVDSARRLAVNLQDGFQAKYLHTCKHGTVWIFIK